MLLAHTVALALLRLQQGQQGPGQPRLAASQNAPSAFERIPGAAPRSRLSLVPTGHHQRLPRAPAPARENSGQRQGRSARHGTAPSRCRSLPCSRCRSPPCSRCRRRAGPGRAEPQPRVRVRAVRAALPGPCAEYYGHRLHLPRLPPAPTHPGREKEEEEEEGRG